MTKLLLQNEKFKWKSVSRFLLLACMCISLTTVAQVSGYTFTSSAGTYTAITGGNTVGTATNDDGTYTALPIGFNFYYNGNYYSQFGINSNGWIFMGSGTPSNTYDAISSANSGSNVIAPSSRDLQGRSGTAAASLRYQTLGTAPNRELVVQWTNYKRYGSTNTGDTLNFQIRLKETTGIIQFVYGKYKTTATTSFSVQTGLKGTSTADFNNRTTTSDWTNSNAGTTSTSSMSVSSSVFPPVGLTYEWNPNLPPLDLGISSLVAPVSGACYSGADSVTFALTNLGTATVDFSVTPATITSSVSGTNPQTFPVATINTGTLAPGSTQNVTVANAYNITAAGTYTFNASVNVTGDGNSANDAMTPANITVVAPIPLPFTENFNMFTTLPTGWTGTMQVIANHGTSGSNGLSRNLYSSVPYAEALTPRIGPAGFVTTLSFDYRIIDWSGYPSTPTTIGTGDSMAVMISTDCGVTFNTIYTVNSANHTTSMNFENVLLVLPISSGQSFELKFAAYWSTGDYYFDMDNINIIDQPAFDAGVHTINSPASGCGLSSSEIIGVDIKNFGYDTLTSFNVSYSINGGSPVTESVSDTILPYSTYSYSFTTPANMSALGNHNITAYTSLGGDGNNMNDTLQVNITNTLLVTSYPYVQDFEDTITHWMSAGTNNSWALGAPAGSQINSAASGTNAWVTNLTGTYNNSEVSHVTGPCFDFTNLQNPWIIMDLWWSTENNWDGAIVQSSVDGGATWQKVGAFGGGTNWYNNDNMSSAVAGQYEAWNGSGANSSNGWINVRHPLTGLGGQSGVRLRILFDSDGSGNSNDGVAFDNVVITQPPVVDLGPDTTICGVYTLNAGNPGATYYWSTGDSSQTVSLEFNSGLTHVVVSDTFGLSSSDTANIIVRPNPVADLGSDITMCNSGAIILNPGGGNNTYLWSNGSTTQTLYVSTWVPAPTSLNFSVDVTNQYGCTDSDSITIFVQNCTSVEEMNAGENISVFPNPSNGIITLTAPASVIGNGSATVTIINMVGEVVMSNTLTLENSSLDLSTLATGVYHLRVRGEHFDKVTRVVINR